MYQRILVPVDGSPAARRGLSEAIALAKDQGAKLRIVHVVNEWLVVSPDASGANLGDVVQQMLTAGRALLNDADALARRAGVNANTVLLEEMGAQAGACILKHAGEWPADLIVCGTHGRRGMRRLLLGSDAEYIVRNATVPVLLLRGSLNNGDD